MEYGSTVPVPSLFAGVVKKSDSYGGSPETFVPRSALTTR